MKILKTSSCSVCDRELLSRYNDAFLLMKTSKDFAVFEGTQLIFETNNCDDAASAMIDTNAPTRYMYDAFHNVIVTQGYVNANKSDYFSDYGHDDDYDDGYVDDDYSDDDVEYMSMRDREISSYSF